MTNNTRSTSSSRIPAALQAVFLAGNRGKDVYEPPPDRAADKVYHHNWRFQTRGAAAHGEKNGCNSSARSSSSCRSLFGDSQSKIKCLSKPVVHVPASEVTNVPSAPSSPRRRTVGEKTKRSTTSSSTTTAATTSTSFSSSSPDVSTSLLDQQQHCCSSPQEFLDKMLSERGYSTDTYKTLQTAYHNAPTSHQQASYGAYMSQVVRQGNVQALRCMLQGGMSPNPCNSYGESILHLICRRGNVDMLQVMRHFGSNFQVSDDYGRTPLHDACWAPQPAFAVVDLLLQIDARLFYMMDRRGFLPLSYVHKDHWPAWREFLHEIKDVHFPMRDTPQGPPDLAKYGPHSRPLPTPEHALPDNLAAIVAAGRMTILEANMVAADQEEAKKQQGDDATADATWEESDSEDDDDSECYYSDDDESECSEAEDDSDYDSEDYDGSDYDDSSSSDEDFPDDLYEILQMTQARLG